MTIPLPWKATVIPTNDREVLIKKDGNLDTESNKVWNQLSFPVI